MPRSPFQIATVRDQKNSPAVQPAHSRLQTALAKIVTDEEIEEIIRAIVQEAKTGTAVEKRNARQILLGMIGGKAARPASLVQNNFYSGKETDNSEITGLVASYLESDGPAGEETIAANVLHPVVEVRKVLKSNVDLFRRVPSGAGMKWDRVR